MYVLKAADIIAGSAAFSKTDADQTVFRSGRLLHGPGADPERLTSDPGCELIVVVEIISVFNALPFDAVIADSLSVVPEPDADVSRGGYGSFDGPFTDPYLGGRAIRINSGVLQALVERREPCSVQLPSSFSFLVRRHL
jgi:hypothetical protein